MNTATCRSTARIVGFGPLKVLKPLRFFHEISGTPKAFDLAIETWHVPRRAPCHALPSASRSDRGSASPSRSRKKRATYFFATSSVAVPHPGLQHVGRCQRQRGAMSGAECGEQRHIRIRIRTVKPSASQAKRTTVLGRSTSYSMHTALHVTLQLGTTHTPQPDSASVRVTRLLLSETHISLYRAAPATVLVAVGATCRSLTELQHEV